MVNKEDSSNSPENPSRENPETAQKNETLFSPRFRSVAAMAGWDEEALLVASLTVEDTPERQTKQKKRSNLPNFKTPPSNSRRKRRAQRNPSSIPIAVLDLDEELNESTSKQDKIKVEVSGSEKVEKIRGDDEMKNKDSGVPSTSAVIPCIDQLREELSCAICLEICYEPSTTPCGHSFCKKCLRSAADKCGKKCPKCRQIISNWRNCTVNTVLWNTIQLLFPQEVKARKSACAPASDSYQEPQRKSEAESTHHNAQYHSVQALNSPESEPRGARERRTHRIRTRGPRTSGSGDVVSMRRELARSQDEDAALALRLQREEFIEAFRVTDDRSNRNSITSARANLRAMASRAINIRIRDRINN